MSRGRQRVLEAKTGRSLAAAGIAKKLYDESRKPENRARVRAAVEKVKARRRS